MVDVEVDDQDSTQSMMIAGLGGGDRDVAVEAKTHRLGFPGVMSRRPHQRHGALVRPGEHAADGSDRRTGRQSRGQIRTLRHPGIGLDMTTAGGLELGDLVQVVGRMDASELGGRGLANDPRRTALVEPSALELAQHRLEPLGPLRMTGRGGVVEHPPVGEQGDHRWLLDAPLCALRPAGSPACTLSPAPTRRQLPVCFTWNAGDAVRREFS